MRDRNRVTTPPGTPLASDTTTAEALRRVLATPPIARTYLLHVANTLSGPGHDQPLTARSWADALAAAHDTVLASAPLLVANDTAARFFQAIEPMRPGETNGEYAIRLRAWTGRL
ncbi:MAG TPA: hypothetical protein VFY14_03925 [Streptomyces sp.]|nr:hypothetical protein [Streptomyces sp.]